MVGVLIMVVLVAMVAVVVMHVAIMVLMTSLLMVRRQVHQGLRGAVIDVTVLLSSCQHHHADQANACESKDRHLSVALVLRLNLKYKFEQVEGLVRSDSLHIAQPHKRFFLRDYFVNISRHPAKHLVKVKTSPG